MIDDIKRPGKAVPSATSRPIVAKNHSMMVNDPMVVPNTTNDASTQDKPTAPVLHTAKVIKPLDTTLKVPAADDAKETSDVEQPVAATGGPNAETETEPKESKPFEITPPSSVVKAQPAETPESANTEVSEVEAVPSVPEEQPVSEPAAASVTTSSIPDPETEPAKSAVAPETDAPAKSETTDKEVQRDQDAAATAEEIAAAESQAVREHELEALVASGKYRLPINAVQRKRSHVHVLVLSILALVLAVALVDVTADAGLVPVPAYVPHTHFFSSTKG